MKLHQLLRCVPVYLLLVVLTGCSAGKIAVKERYFWPPPPDEPKIEWLTTYYDDSDLRGGVSVLRDLVGEQSDLRFFSPLFIAGDGSNRIVVSDPAQVGFIVMDLARKKFDMLGGTAMAGDISKPTGVAFDGQGLIYAGDDKSRKIYVVNQQNRVVKVLDLSADLKSVGAFAIDKQRGHLIIPDINTHSVAIFSLDGKLIKSIGKRGGEDGEFNFPVAAVVDKQGTIFVTDSFNARIQRFSPEGLFVSKFGKRGDGIGDFGIIKGMAIDSDNHIYVMDARFNRMQIFDTNGEILMTIGASYAQRHNEAIVAAGFLLPQDIYIDNQDRIYVTDMGNRRIQLFQYLNENELKKYRLEKGQGTVRAAPAK